MKEFFEFRRLKGTIALTLSSKRKWTADKAIVCGQIVDTVNRYRRQGYRLTLRQLYYQLVAADYIPNDDIVYKKMSGILDDLRYSGKVDWDSIEDRGRVPYLPYWVTDIPDALNDTINSYRLDRMEGQPKKVEVWTEKDAISGILKRVTERFHVRLVVNKGYSSSSAMHGAYLRFAGEIRAGKKVVILYFGDHDPSGLDMIRDIRERILFFLTAGESLDWDVLKNDEGENVEYWWENGDFNLYDLNEEGYLSDAVTEDLNAGMRGEREPKEESESAWNRAQRAKFLTDNKIFEVIPIGLTWDQIQEHRPPPNPAKITDPRAKWYIEQHGGTSYEVDALNPALMEEIVTENIENHIDADLFEDVKIKEQEQKEQIRAFAESFKNDPTGNDE
jgi:hypothetical protein